MYSKILVALVVLAAVAGCAMFKHQPAAPQPTMATLALTVNAKGAEVYIDDSLFGQIARGGSVQDFVVSGGKHTLVVKKFGYEDFTAKIGVEAGGVNTLAVTLKRTPAVKVNVAEEKPEKPAAKEAAPAEKK
jgi:hypothetical protein